MTSLVHRQRPHSIARNIHALMLASAALVATAVMAATEVRAQARHEPKHPTAVKQEPAKAEAVIDVAAPDDLRAADLVVKYDQSSLVELKRNASEIIVGNPSIAEVGIQAGNLLIVTGKTFGVTNLIVLDIERKKIMERRIVVTRDDARTVHIWRATARSTYNCAQGESCNPSLMIGDDPAHFKKALEHATNKQAISSGADNGTAPSPAQ